MKESSLSHWEILDKHSYNIEGQQNDYKSQQNVYLTHQQWNQSILLYSETHFFDPIIWISYDHYTCQPRSDKIAEGQCL